MSSERSAHVLAFGEIVDGSRRLEGFAQYELGEPLPERLQTDWVELFPASRSNTNQSSTERALTTQ